MIGRELSRIATAATFLTRTPCVARHASGAAAELAASARYFPLIGVGVGLLGGAVYALAALAVPRDAAALLAVAATALATGAFHEDGWADAWDGLAGGADRERRLAIMRDSRIGSYGALALVLLVLGKVAALAAMPPATAVLALVAAHALARASAPVLARALPYAREDGAAKPVVEGIGGVELGIALIIALAATVPLAVALGARATAALALLVVATVATAGVVFQRRIGGITGDCLGAANQAIEVGVLLVAAAALS